MLARRTTLALGAAVLAGVAMVAAVLDGDSDLVPFFLGLTLAAGAGSWAVREPYVGGRRTVARGLAIAWLGAAGWIGVLLLMFQATCACSFPEPRGPEATYLGLTATVYHLVGVYVGGALMATAAFSRSLASERA